jgi:uncharacterized protein YmfQ (DUF2313 family)
MKRIAILLIAAAAAVCSAPALAEDVVIKKSSPSVDVTVGSGSDRVVKEKEVVIDKREPRASEKMIIEKERKPEVVEKKTIIKERD